jgi:membrane protease YdiL (CAAX protease family)
MIVLQFPIGAYVIAGNGLDAEVGREAVFWALTALMVCYILFVERRPLSTISLRLPNWKSLTFGSAGAAAMIAGMALIYMVVFPAIGLSSNEAGLVTLKATPVWFKVMLIVRAAVFEELYYRGFAIERLTEITRLRWLAAAISLLAFTFAHLNYWGWAHLIVAGFGGIILTGLYLWRRDLSCNMIAHLLTDAVGILAA